MKQLSSEEVRDLAYQGLLVYGKSWVKPNTFHFENTHAKNDIRGLPILMLKADAQRVLPHLPYSQMAIFNKQDMLNRTLELYIVPRFLDGTHYPKNEYIESLFLDWNASAYEYASLVINNTPEKDKQLSSSFKACLDKAQTLWAEILLHNEKNLNNLLGKEFWKYYEEGVTYQKILHHNKLLARKFLPVQDMEKKIFDSFETLDDLWQYSALWDDEFKGEHFTRWTQLLKKMVPLHSLDHIPNAHVKLQQRLPYERSREYVLKTLKLLEYTQFPLVEKIFRDYFLNSRHKEVVAFCKQVLQNNQALESKKDLILASGKMNFIHYQTVINFNELKNRANDNLFLSVTLLEMIVKAYNQIENPGGVIKDGEYLKAWQNRLSYCIETEEITFTLMTLTEQDDFQEYLMTYIEHCFTPEFFLSKEYKILGKHPGRERKQHEDNETIVNQFIASLRPISLNRKLEKNLSRKSDLKNTEKKKGKI